VLTEGGAVDQVLGHHRRLVKGAIDLLDDHPTLTVELLRVDPGAADEVAEQVDRRGSALGADCDVEGDEIVARVGVQHAAESLGGLIDVLVMGVLLTTLEDEVLEEVSHPVLLGTLVASACIEGHENRQSARSRQLDPVDRQAVCGHGGGRYVRHQPTLEGSPAARQPRSLH
jgi:NAD(P)-dependent dehydrogenase (short-subunit alcohol dehydrogenase family)